MNFHLTSAEDCKSSIPQFDSESRLHSPLREFEGIVNKSHASVVEEKKLSGYRYGSVQIPVTLTDHGSYVGLNFTYKNTSHSHRLYIALSELTGNDISTTIEKVCRKIDGTGTIKDLLDLYLEHGTGSEPTRKKNVAHIKDLFSREGWDLSDSIKFLSEVDELGRTLPERWEAIFNLPHKLRQIRSIFGRKNLLLFKRNGWDTSYFGNFLAFIPETTVSQPFTTDDSEVDHIINFFNGAREQHPIFYDIYMLAFGCGLRKSEIYQIEYSNFTTFNGQHFLLLPFATKRSKLKQTNHVEKVGISRQVYDHFTCREQAGRVVHGGERLHRRFVSFLKSELGMTENKACHRLRKILGARLASTAGIFHAAKTLRNSVAVAEKYYSDLTAHRNELEV